VLARIAAHRAVVELRLVNLNIASEVVARDRSAGSAVEVLTEEFRVRMEVCQIGLVAIAKLFGARGGAASLRHV